MVEDTEDLDDMLLDEVVEPRRRNGNACRCAFDTEKGSTDSEDDNRGSSSYERGGFWNYNDIINSFSVDTWVLTTDVFSYIPSLKRVVGAFRNTAMFRRCIMCNKHVPFDKISRKMLDIA